MRFLDFTPNDKESFGMKRPKASAGLLMFRRRDGKLEVLLVHPGGPYFQNKDGGAWTIPKGEVVEGEDLLERAKIEFEEELGISVAPSGPWIELGWVKQKGGKSVHGWAFEGNLPESFAVASNTFDCRGASKVGHWASKVGHGVRSNQDAAFFAEPERSGGSVKNACAPPSPTFMA